MMEIVSRKMEKGDVQKLLEIYQKFAERYVGCIRRDLRYYRKFLRKQDDLRWVVLDKNNRLIGYVLGRYEKRRKRGRITEIVVDPHYDFSTVAKLLVEKLQSVFIEKNAAVIDAASIKNPFYAKVFPDLGFFDVKTDGVFMYTVLDVSKFLHEISPILATRLKNVEDWNGLIQIRCDEYNLLFRKDLEEVEEHFWTNMQPDCNIALDKDTLTRLLLGVVDVLNLYKTGKITIKAKFTDEKTEQILKALFPKPQFLALDYW